MVKALHYIPILQEVMNNTWKKENELKDLKSELNSLDRKIQLTLSSKDAVEEKVEDVKVEIIKPTEIKGVQQEYRGVRM